jgi:adenosylcobinamide-phosphate synthase
VTADESRRWSSIVRPSSVSGGRAALTLALALALDLLAGDPPNRWHPVAWMGTLIGYLQRHAPAAGKGRRFAYGLGLVTVGLSLTGGTVALFQRMLKRTPVVVQILCEALLLKMTLSPVGLTRAANAVYEPLQVDDLPAARDALSWHLVSRKTDQLDRTEVAAAAVESVAENASDGVVAPMFFFALGGLPLAFAYRFLNTADSMLGYRDPGREWVGKGAARLDDLANWLPARLTALLITLAAFWTDGSGPRAWQIWRRDGRRTASPNAGQPMSAMAGALGVELTKSGHYRLGQGEGQAQPGDILRSVRLLWGATAGAFLACALIAALGLRFGRAR